MQPVERGQLWVMWIHALWMALVLIAGAITVESAIAKQGGALPTGSILLPLILLLAYPVLFAPRRRYQALGYAVDAEELRIGRGVWTRTETIVPLGRVQHIDLSQGPIERACGVCRLVLHTAGTMNSLVVLPGLSRSTAEAIRDEIRTRIRQSEP